MSDSQVAPTIPHPLSVEAWMQRHIAPPDFLLGELLSTTSRAMLVGPTGLGKTMLCLDIAFAMALGRDFLHWHPHRAVRVLYIDGEMAEYDFKERLEATVMRWGDVPSNLFILSRDALTVGMPPLNVKAGQKFVNDYITELGGVDFIIFDNIQALTAGNQRETDIWQKLQPWVLDLTSNHIGQLWMHHTNEDDRSYGDKTREWQMTTVMVMKAREADHPKFKLEFSKARGRKKSNRADFEPMVFELKNDQWHTEPDKANGATGIPAKDRLFTLLVKHAAITPPPDLGVPAGRRCITGQQLNQAFFDAELQAGSKETSILRAYNRGMKALRQSGAMGEGGGLFWDATTTATVH